MLFLEHQEIYQGYHLVVTFNIRYRCGYVGLPKGHKFVGMDWRNDEVDNLSAHKGITYGGIPHFKLNDYAWYLGFFCSYSGDADDIESMEEYGIDENTIEYSRRHFSDGEVRTKEYVLNELYKLVEQLKGE